MITLKQILTSFLYAIFVLITLTLVLFLLDLIEKYFGLSSYLRIGFIESIIITSIVSVVLFLIGNLILQKIERVEKLILFQHFRQTWALYGILFVAGIQLLTRHDIYNLSIKYALLSLLIHIALLGIITNGMFLSLYKRKKRKS